MMAHANYLMVLAMVVALTGCGPEGTGGNTEMDRMAAAVDKPKPAPAEAQHAQAVPPARPASQPAAQPTPPAAPPQQTAAQATPASGQVAGKVNVEETHQLKPDGSYMGAIMAANRSIRNRLDDIAWKKSVQFYEATNGHLPKNTEEFLNLVQSEGTPLPEIDEGLEYEYDPSEGQFGTLYEVTPTQPSASP
jgi:hypothetical protein